MVEPSARESESMDIMYLLERLEEVLGGGTRLPFTNRALVDDEDCFQIIDQIRLSLPNEIPHSVQDDTRGASNDDEG